MSRHFVETSFLRGENLLQLPMIETTSCTETASRTKCISLGIAIQSASTGDRIPVPSRPATAAAIVAVGALIGVALAVRPSAAPPSPGASSAALDPASTPAARPAVQPPIDLNASEAALPTADPAAVATGRAVYAAHCASCHGARGEGEPDWQTEREDGSLPAPPHDASGHTWHHADADLIRIVAKGGTVYMPTSRMPGYRTTLTPDEIAAVLTFIKATFWGPRERLYQAEISRQRPTDP